MCYVVAKNANKIGSVAIRMKLGKPVVQLKAEMKAVILTKASNLSPSAAPPPMANMLPTASWTRFRSSRRKSRSCNFPQSCNSPQARGAQVLTDLRAAFLYSPHFSLTQ